MGTTGAVQAAFDAACDEKDHYVQTVMMLQFAYSHEAQAMSALIAGLKHSKVEVRRACAYALMGSDDSRALTALKDARGDPDEQVRIWAADALKAVQPRQSVTHPASK